MLAAVHRGSVPHQTRADGDKAGDGSEGAKQGDTALRRGERMATAATTAVEGPPHISSEYTGCSMLCRHHLMLCRKGPRTKALLTSQG